LIEQMSQLAEKIPSNAAIFVSENDPVVRLVSGLEFIFRRPCFVVHYLPHMHGRERAMQRAIELWSERGISVCFLSSETVETLGISGATSRPIAQGLIQTRAIDASDTELMTTQTALNLPYTLNQITLISPPAPTPPHRAP